VIASQALISGAFSLTRQAMLLGYLPRVTIKHTAYHTEGQIYIPEVNHLLAIGCLALVLTFRQSVKLAAAYGIAVTGTMAITSILYYIVVRYRWGWSRWKAGALLALFLSFDIPFLVANLFIFLDGGYVPMMIGAALIAGMLIWSRGRTVLMAKYANRFATLDAARPLIARAVGARARGRGVHLAQRRPRSAGSGASRRAQPVAARNGHPGYGARGDGPGRAGAVSFAVLGPGRRLPSARNLLRIHGAAAAASCAGGGDCRPRHLVQRRRGRVLHRP
jgi:hypothetical protein